MGFVFLYVEIYVLVLNSDLKHGPLVGDVVLTVMVDGIQHELSLYFFTR